MPEPVITSLDLTTSHLRVTHDVVQDVIPEVLRDVILEVQRARATTVPSDVVIVAIPPHYHGALTIHV